MSPDDPGLTTLAGEVLTREAAAVAALTGTVEEGVVSIACRLLEVSGKVVTTGSGTSGIMAERLAHLLSVCGTPALYLPAMDALHGGLGAVTPHDLVLAISKTGRSAELTRLTERLVERGWTSWPSPRMPRARSPPPPRTSRCCPARRPTRTPAT